AGIMGVTAALAWINVESEAQAEAAVEEEAQEILQDHVARERKRYEWLKARWQRGQGNDETMEEEPSEPSPRVDGRPLPSAVTELRAALKARLQALRSFEAGSGRFWQSNC
ncbi:unnamed protein product, partial [Effrenium voratum]